MNAHELALRLAERAADVAQYLLPGGKKSSGEWKAGSVSGDAGQSLSVRLSGAKAGVWRDFAADEGGDLLDLWAACRGLSVSQAMNEVKAYLGVRDSMTEQAPELLEKDEQVAPHQVKASNVVPINVLQ